MIQPIIRDVLFLSRRSEPATLRDLPVCEDLRDTLRAHRESCVGMAANMIGVSKRIIIVDAGFTELVMLNPVLLSKAGPFEAEEGCLSLTGARKTTRYREIRVQYTDPRGATHRQPFSGWIAQIIQHEMDHLEGIII